MGYGTLHLTKEDIQEGRYKKHLGGGSEHWQQRDAFQLYFLQRLGLRPSSRLLDIGCGPLRAGVHLISYLDEGNYCGFDSNESFVTAARHVVRVEKLESKRPRLELVRDFHFAPLDLATFDYGLVFSVLNHCSLAERQQFFRNMPGAMSPLGRVFVSHAHWFREPDLHGSRFRLTKTIDGLDFDVTQFGWSGRSGVFPIVELTVD